MILGHFEVSNPTRGNDAVTGDADWIAPATGHHGSPLHASAWVDGPEEPLVHVEPEPPAAPDAAPVEVESLVESLVEEQVEEKADDRRDQPSTGQAPEQTAEAETDQQARRPAKKGRGRASVPTWDEIMFGGGRGD